MLNSLSMQDLSAQSHALSSGVCTSLELTHTLLKRIHARNPVLNAYLHIDDEGALRDAAKSDARRKHGKLLGPLDGLSLAVKDNIDVMAMPTTAGMATRRARMATRDSFVVRQLRQAGMLVMGKLNMHEAALGATNDNPHFGRCENPLRAGFTPLWRRGCVHWPLALTRWAQCAFLLPTAAWSDSKPVLAKSRRKARWPVADCWTTSAP